MFKIEQADQMNMQSRKAALQEEGLETEKPLGVIWRGLTVKGVGSTASFVHTLDRAILASFGGNALNVFCEKFPYIANKIPGRHVAVRNLIEDFSGALKDEMVRENEAKSHIVCLKRECLATGARLAWIWMFNLPESFDESARLFLSCGRGCQLCRYRGLSHRQKV